MDTHGLVPDVLKGKAKAQWSGKHVEKSGSCKVEYGHAERLSGEIQFLGAMLSVSWLTQLLVPSGLHSHPKVCGNVV